MASRGGRARGLGQPRRAEAVYRVALTDELQVDEAATRRLRGFEDGLSTRRHRRRESTRTARRDRAVNGARD